jgi:hypothetical protein
LRDLLKAHGRNKKDLLRRFDLGADRLAVVAFRFEALDLGARDLIGRLGIREDAPEPEPYTLRVGPLTILPGANHCSGADRPRTNVKVAVAFGCGTIREEFFE